MTSVLLDSNVYDRLRDDPDTRGRLARLVAAGGVRVVATPKVVDELRVSPFAGLPTWFPISTPPESVAVLGHWRLGEAVLGEGEVYAAHRGSSGKVADAIIADSAASLAEFAVSLDGRFRKRLAELGTSCTVMSYEHFREWLALEERRR